MKKVLVIAIIGMFLIAGNEMAYAVEKEQGVLNLNTATMDQIMMLFDHEKAMKIVEYRKTNGGFKEPRDILKVKGIGMKTYMTIKRHLVMEGPTTLVTPHEKSQAHAHGSP